ncbi:hypothetical protein G7046_g2996 [Stylonectria norvegica]|nr:hypothetical protein G7046_g2996 [Stylonectria norvegica]
MTLRPSPLPPAPTSVQTITSCAPEVTNCPAKSGSTVVTTVIVAVSTTICPVTETRVHSTTGPAGPDTTVATGTGPAGPGSSAPSNGASSAKPVTTGPHHGSAPATTAGSGSPTTSASEAEETLPCPSVVPSCLNTFLYLVDHCKDNTDVACYCPDKDYVDSIFQCLYAHGESDDVVSEAVSFFQGICAPYVGSNPGIATGADSVTTIITVTGTPTVTSAHYTTVVVATTITEPCITEGSTIVGSSTVRTISTEITVPQVGFTTASTGASTGVEVIAPPTATATAPVATGPAGSAPNAPAPTAPAGSSAAAGIPTTPATLLTSKPVPVGTGGAVPSTTGVVPITAGAGRAGMSFAAAMLAIALVL